MFVYKQYFSTLNHQFIMEKESRKHCTEEHLRKCSYRFLQKTAKARGLPSNVKKVHLINLILTRLYGTPEALVKLVYWVKNERLSRVASQKENTRKMSHVQGIEISSTSGKAVESPRIINTPRRNIHRNGCHNPTIVSRRRPTEPSDRVLRNRTFLGNKRFTSVNSCNIRGTCYEAIINNVPSAYSPALPPARRRRTLSGIYLLKPQMTRFEVVRNGFGLRHKDGTFTKINALVKKADVMPRNREDGSTRISIKLQDIINKKVTSKTYACNNRDYIPGFCKVLPPIQSNYADTEYGNVAVVPLKLTDGSDSQNTIVTRNTYNCDSEEYIPQLYNNTTTTNNNEDTVATTQIRPQFVNNYVENLPRIHEVFGNINNVAQSDVTRPFYVGIEKNSPLLSALPEDKQEDHSTVMLESLYNFKKSFQVTSPLPPIATKAKTTCVFSTHVTATAAQCEYGPDYAQTNMQLYTPVSDLHTNESYNCINISDQESPLNLSAYSSTGDFYTDNPYNYINNPDQEYSLSIPDVTTFESTLEELASQLASGSIPTLSEDVSIPCLFEDAFDLISQDGNYFERRGLQCVCCEWAGPRALLENHFITDHATSMMLQISDATPQTY